MTSREQSRGGNRRLIRKLFSRTLAIILGGSLGLAVFSSAHIPSPGLAWQMLLESPRPAHTAPASLSGSDLALAADPDAPRMEMGPFVGRPAAAPPPPVPTPPFNAAPETDFPPLIIPPDEYLKPFPPPEPTEPPPPPEYNPLTGLNVARVENLERRPLGIKITLFPREVRPQSGVNLADLVFEYYLEHGMTRFFAVFYGQDVDRVGPVRSGRFFDEHLVRMYKSIFVFANADRKVLDHFLETELVNYFVVERPDNCPPMCRDPWMQGYNNLFTNTRQLTDYITIERGVENQRQDLSGMVFDILPPEGGVRGTTIGTTYSTTSYNEWRFDPTTGQYLRFQETENYTEGEEVYAPLLDTQTDSQISTENVVQLLIPHEYYTTSAEVVLMHPWGYGQAYVYRDGLAYRAYWQRLAETDVLSLVNADGTPFPLKPGRTFFQVVGRSTQVWQFGEEWRFKFQIP